MAKVGVNGSLIFEIGNKMPDGSIFAGIVTDENGHKYPIYSAPYNCRKKFSHASFAKIAEKTRNGWDLPTAAEAKVLLANREKGSLKHTFDLVTKGYLTKDFGPAEPCISKSYCAEVVRATEKDGIWSCYEDAESLYFSARLVRRGAKIIQSRK